MDLVEEMLVLIAGVGPREDENEENQGEDEEGRR